VSVVRIEQRGQFFHVWTPYHRAYVTDLKCSISGRRWDQDAGCWIIHERHRDALMLLLAEHFGYLEDDPYRALHLLPSAPPEVAKAAYRALAQIHHPDRGGSHEAMQRVNTAWETLSRSLAA